MCSFIIVILYQQDGTWVDSKDEVFSEAGIENVILPLITSTEECDSESVSVCIPTNS